MHRSFKWLFEGRTERLPPPPPPLPRAKMQQQSLQMPKKPAAKAAN
jgi:hypothetical protein